MPQFKLPFKLGGQYENWEFDLEPIFIDRLKGYDSYIYLKEITVLDVIPKRVELIFNLDILSAVILQFNRKDFNKLHMLEKIGFTKKDYYFFYCNINIHSTIYNSLLC